jgi:dipeptidyl aminopeptidase/acylaminoacyl peptidase
MRTVLTLILLGAGLPAQVLPAAQPPFDAAKAFGARPSVTSISVSPDGTRVAYVTPGEGTGSKVFAMGLANKARPSLVLSSDGKPFRITFCDWVSNDRLVCRLFGVVPDARLTLARLYRLVAVNADGTNLQLLSNRINGRSRGYLVRGYLIIDWLPDQSGNVLMERDNAPDTQIGSRIGSDKQGIGVDLVDTRTLAAKKIEEPLRDTYGYITDGHGNVRVRGVVARDNRGVDKGFETFEYRTPGSSEWRKLSEYNDIEQEGFQPEVVDPTLNIVYGFKKQNGRRGLYSISLDGSLQEKLVYDRPDTDMGDLIQIARRVVGVSYITDKPHDHYFVPEIAELFQSLREAIPQSTLHFVESSTDPDHNTMLFFAHGDDDPGVYYIFDRKTHHLDTFLVARSELEGVKLAGTQKISYPVADGTSVPAYLTLPPGQDRAKATGLPAVVLTPSGADPTDSFDWQAQFFAARGYAVLRLQQYDKNWSDATSFQAWNAAVSDINGGGRWLVSQGIADPRRLAVMGWTYGGYAALQSAVVDPGVFKAIIAIAPITDLNFYRDELVHWTNSSLRKAAVGSGPNLRAGSPIDQVDRITAPVLLFHGELDRDVLVAESKRMAARLAAAGKACKLVTWPNLDNELADSGTRAEMLRTSDQFMRQALGLGADLAGTTPAARSPE